MKFGSVIQTYRIPRITDAIMGAILYQATEEPKSKG